MKGTSPEGQTGTTNLVIVRPNAFSYSETFIDAHVRGLQGAVKTIYGGHFPVFDHQGKYLIRNPFALAWYLFQKRFLGRKSIAVRTRALVNYFKREKTDVVLAEYGVTGAMIYEACREAGIPLVIHFHGFDASDRRTLNEYGKLYIPAFAYASRIIAVSAEMQKKLLELGAPAEKLVYLNYGVDTQRFIPSDEPAEPASFISVARFAEKKAPLSTIEAFAKVLKEVPKATLVMAGDGPLLEASKNRVRELGIEVSVSFAGQQNPEQVAALMKKASIFLQHSVVARHGDSEGTPNSILEASASGLAIASTRHGGIPEAVLHGLTGFLVEEGDVTQMASYMTQLAQNPELTKKMGLAGREHILLNYNQKTQLAKLDSILDEACMNFTA